MPARHGKKYMAALKLLEEYELVDPRRGSAWSRRSTPPSFPGTVELHARLGVDPRHADQMVRGSVVLPHGTGKVRRIVVFAQGEKEREAREAGAEIIGGEDLVKRVQEGFLDFDVALATPDLMGSVGRLGKVLGPRGLMPNPKAGTVTFDIAKAIRDVQAGRVEFRVDRYGIIHVPVGKTSFEDDALLREPLRDVGGDRQGQAVGGQGRLHTGRLSGALDRAQREARPGAGGSAQLQLRVSRHRVYSASVPASTVRRSPRPRGQYCSKVNPAQVTDRTIASAVAGRCLEVGSREPGGAGRDD